MLDWVFVGIALAVQGAGGSGGAAGDRAASTAEAPAISAQAQAQFEAEDQTPTGRFTTATEVKPILNATRANWVAIREYDGQDLLYLTHLLSWRCGLHQIRYAVNDGPLQSWPMPPCLLDSAQPNAIRT